MIFRETPLLGAYVVEQEPAVDSRGSFARFFCTREYEAHGLVSRIVQCSISTNKTRGTLRGLHYQSAPHSEAKTVRCLRGAVFDVIADLRPDSPSRHQWFGIELTGSRGTALYVPPGVAHGFVTLADDSVVEYLISEFYVPEAASGVRYDDPTLNVTWPISPVAISDWDNSLPTLVESGRV